jgi:hypothetical protein
MAAKGNATALHFLFAEPKEIATHTWHEIQNNRDVFLSRNSAQQFLGFAGDQFKRLSGEKGSGKKGQRPEYIGRFGYDTKAAMHGLRLLYECLELMTHGQITWPGPEKELLIEVRSGAWPLQKVLALANQLFEQVGAAIVRSALPERVDPGAVSHLISRIHLEFWRRTASCGTEAAHH